MTAVRPWAEVAADLRSQAVGCDEDIRHVLMREAADLIEALAAERDVAQAVIAEVRAALDRYGEDHEVGEVSWPALVLCVSAIRVAVRS